MGFPQNYRSFHTVPFFVLFDSLKNNYLVDMKNTASRVIFSYNEYRKIWTRRPEKRAK